jgi:signal transduction histidine kinase
LLLRSPDDVGVLRAAPWWNPRHALLVVSALAGAALLTLAWAATLRRRVRAQSAVIWETVKRETELQERQRMARELHDTLEQNLTGIGLALEAAQRALPPALPRVERHLALALAQVRNGIDEVRHAVWALRSRALDASGPAEALAEIGQKLARCGAVPIDVTTRVRGRPRPLPAETENNLLRIGQEALTNAVRHARATRIEVALHYDGDEVRLSVSDDGKGFDAGAASPRGHYGICGMRERASQMDAALVLASAPDRGTLVSVAIPLKPPASSGLSEAER